MKDWLRKLLRADPPGQVPDSRRRVGVRPIDW